MHIVLTWENWEMDKCRWFRNTLLGCQSKLLSQKGRHTFHEMEQEWVFGGKGMQEISALIPGVKFSFTWFHRPQLLAHAPALRCQREGAYTNSNHAKHFFLFAVNWHNPGHSLTTKPCNTTGLMFGAVVQRLAWSFPICLQHPNRPTMHSHMQQISLFVYWRIMPVNFLPGFHVLVHPRVTRTHGNSNRAGRVGGLAACVSAVS